MKKIIVIDASPRCNGNSKVTSDAIASKVKDATVEVFRLREKKVNPCLACDACKRREVAACVQEDDMSDLLPRLDEADAIILLTPIYFGQVTGPMKTFIDRLYCYFHPAHAMMSLAKKRGKKCLMIGFCGMGPADQYKAYLQQTVACMGVVGADDRRVLLCNEVNEPGSCMQKTAFVEALYRELDTL